MFRQTIPMQAIFFERNDLVRILAALKIHRDVESPPDGNSELIAFIEACLAGKEVA